MGSEGQNQVVMFARQAGSPLGHLPSHEGSSLEAILTSTTLTSNSLHTPKVSPCWALTCVSNCSTLSSPRAHTSTSQWLPAALLSFPLASLASFLITAAWLQWKHIVCTSHFWNTVCMLSHLPVLSPRHCLGIRWLDAGILLNSADPLAVDGLVGCLYLKLLQIEQ